MIAFAPGALTELLSRKFVSLYFTANASLVNRLDNRTPPLPV